jgi:hypothetical protein
MISFGRNLRENPTLFKLMCTAIINAMKYLEIRVARWFIFKPKSQCVNFGGPWNGKGWYILWLFGIYYGHWVHFWPFGNLLPIWYLFGLLSQ